MSDKSFIKDIEKMDFTLPETKVIVLGVIEMLCDTVVELRQEVQELKNEVARLKGEKGKPNIKPNIKPSSKPKMEKGTPKQWKKTGKVIKVDREELVKIDKTLLPKDAVFKGYEDTIIQGVIFESNNVCYKREVFYSASEKKTYIAPMDSSLEGTSFSPELKAQILRFYFECRMPENKIHSLLTSIGISISEGQISNIIIKEQADKFSEEKEEIFNAGMDTAVTSNIDDSGFRENGINKYINIICNAFFSIFIVNDNKKSKTVEEMFAGKDISKIAFASDDAKQFITVFNILQLCWVHEERHYQKLNPIMDMHREELDFIISEIWNFYRELKEYKKTPNELYKKILEEIFDSIFNREVHYPALNKRLKLTYAKKDRLLTVLTHPSVDVHNNRSENGIREGVVKRKVSGGTRVHDGTTAWENHFSIMATCKKQGVSYYEYILTIFKRENHKKSLADLIREKATATAIA